MPLENHDKARSLLDRSLVEGISPEERHWLDAHIAECVECGRYAELSARTVRALNWFSLDLDPAAALRVESVVRRHAEGMRSAEAQTKTVWIGTAIAVCLTFAGSTLAWHRLSSLAGEWNLPDHGWQIAFVAFWVFPSLLLAVLPLFRRRLLGEDSDGEEQPV